ncbi:MAG: glycosyltransferase [Candidatus Zixiibacteriota bacterium]
MNDSGFRVMMLADAGTFHAERFAGELKRQGVEVLVVSLEQGSALDELLNRIGPFRTLHYALSVPQVKRTITRFRPDVINAHYASGYGFVAAAAAGRTPVALNLWGSDILIVPYKSRLHRWKTKYALRRADFVFGDSEYLIQSAVRIAPLSNATVIPWGIEAKFLELHKDSYELNRPVRVIIPRAHEEIYNNRFIVEALAPLVMEGKVTLTFPNFGSQVNDFKKYAHEHVGDRLSLYEKKPRDRFIEFLAEHDIYLSAAFSDSSPVTLIESMALGLIPICADISGVREWLTPQSGFLFRQNDGDQLTEIILRIMQDPAALDDARLNNLARVKEKAVFEKNVAEQISIMKKLAEGARYG